MAFVDFVKETEETVALKGNAPLFPATRRVDKTCVWPLEAPRSAGAPNPPVPSARALPRGAGAGQGAETLLRLTPHSLS